MLTLTEALQKMWKFFDSVCALVKSNRIEKVFKNLKNQDNYFEFKCYLWER